MANTEFNVRIQLKRDTDANWRAKDPQLLAGEVVFVDTNAGEVRTKVGDGTKKYSALPFMDEVLRNLISDSSKPVFYFQGEVGGASFLPTSTVADLNTAYEANRPCFCSFPVDARNTSATAILQLIGFHKDVAYLFTGVARLGNTPTYYQVWSVDGGTSWSYMENDLAKLTDIPTKLSQFENDTNYLNSDTNFVHKTGDEEIKGIKTFESSIVCSMTPGNENHLVNKKYVDNKVGTYLPLAGGKMTGNINMNNKEITQAAKIGFLRGAYFVSSNIQQQNVISAFTSGGSTLAYLNAYARTPEADDNAMVLANKAYVDKKTTVLLKTWTSADVS